MPFEPVIPIAAPTEGDTTIPIPVPATVVGSLSRRAVDSAYFELPAYAPGAVVPPAVAIPGNNGYSGAVLSIEKNGGAATIIARYWLDGRWPTVTTGLPLVDKQIIAINGFDDLSNLRIVSVDGLSHIAQVQFFNYNDTKK